MQSETPFLDALLSEDADPKRVTADILFQVEIYVRALGISLDGLLMKTEDKAHFKDIYSIRQWANDLETWIRVHRSTAQPSPVPEAHSQVLH